MRILHLIDGETGPCLQRVAATVTGRLDSHRHDVLVIGHRGHHAAACLVGLEPLGSLRAPLNRANFARRGLRRYLRRAGRTGARYDVVHAWSWPAAVLALEVAPGPALLVTAVEPPRLELRVLSRFAAAGGQVLAANGTVARACATMLAGEMASVVPPPIDGGPPGVTRRKACRESLGVSPGTSVVALMGEPIAAADAVTVAHVVGRMTLAGRDVRLLLHPASAGRLEAQRLLRRLGMGHTFITSRAPAEPWRVVPAIDVALVLTRGTAGNTLPALWAMAAGVPVIAWNSPAMEETVGDGRGGWLVPGGEINAVANRLLDLIDDPAGAQRLGENGRTIIALRHDPNRYARRMGEAYEQSTRGERIVLDDDDDGAPVVVIRDIERSRV